MTTLKLRDASVMLGAHRALDGVSLTFEPGELVGIMGPNGAGKSTMLRAALGLLPLAGGEVQVRDRSITAWQRHDLARVISFLPQGGTVHWPLTVRALVALGRLPHRQPFGRVALSDETAIEAAMIACEVEAFADKPVTQLSGGERARVLLARALAAEAPILFADEPFAQLDPSHQLHAMEVLQTAARKGTLVLVVLHDLSVAARFCDRIVLLSAGHVVADGTPDAVLTRETLSQTFGVDALIGVHGDARYVVPLKRNATEGRS
jgi:iron complex transport system ATP-binding protein